MIFRIAPMFPMILITTAMWATLAVVQPLKPRKKAKTNAMVAVFRPV